jgi:F-type H+-transporting ATPase subunit b
MLELNFWFFVLAVLFISLYFILNSILFKPLLKVFSEREKAIAGSMEEADEMRQEREQRLDEFKREMSGASQKAKAGFDSLREEGLGKQRDLIEAANKEAQGMIEAARKELQAESEKARASLKGDADKYSDSIVEKLLKV